MKELTCISCPLGCELKVDISREGVVTVTGNTCPRGAAYGKEEVTNPKRTLTSTVRIRDRRNQVVSVKTSSHIPKDKIMDVMKQLAGTWAVAPVHIGDVILENPGDTGVDIVATRTVL